MPLIFPASKLFIIGVAAGFAWAQSLELQKV